MKSLNSFIEHLEEEARNHSIYVWGAQGQDHTIISEEWIKKVETNEKNAARAIAFWKKQVAAGFGDVLKAFDCSGLGMAFLQNETGISKSDMTANGMMGKCEIITKGEVRRGCWVFKVKDGKATHIGYVVDDDLNVIEAKGRDYGVIKSPMKGWNAYGVPKFFADEIKAAAPAPEPQKPKPSVPAGAWEVSRLLKVTVPLTRGDDVKALQTALIAAGYHCGATGADGVFGKNTAYAVRCFQSARGLVVDGKAGKYTVTALDGVWKA